jgi:WD40 repeat protein/serine/threonine protein kinase
MIHADRNLLLGILAMQMNLVGRDALIEAMCTWAGAKDRSLGEILQEQGALSPGRQTLLEALVDEHLSAHGGDPDESLATLSVNTLHCIWEAIKSAAEPLQPTLGRISSSDDIVTLPVFDATLVGGPDSTVAPTAAGTRFLVIRPLARGGIGQVSVALDRELNRQVAVKEILAEQADSVDSRSRFLLEAEITARLEHPGVVPVYGFGYDTNGRPFYAMRFVKGESLKEAIARFHSQADGAGASLGRWTLSLRQLLNRLIAVCNVVEYAHSRGIIHRDLKPANILLGSFGETIVVDWGLGKVVGRQDDVAARTAGQATPEPPSELGSIDTLPGTVFGTPAFMSPEQAGGRLDLVGPASDVYCLGATLYCLLTGKPPVPDSDVPAALRKVQSGQIVPPRQVHPGVSTALESICLKAMAKSPNDRYATPNELARDLECWMADEPVSVYREPISVRLTRWGRRHRTMATGIGVLLVTAVAALGAGTLLLGWANERTEGQRSLAERERQRAELKSIEAREKAEALEHQLYVNRINLAQHEYQDNTARAEDLLDQCPQRLRGWEWSYLKGLCHLDLATVQGHSLGAKSVDFSPDGTKFVSGGGRSYLVASAGDDCELILWDAVTRGEIRRFPGLKGSVHSVRFSPDGSMIAAGSGFYQPTDQGQLSLWSTATGKLLLSKPTDHLNVLSVAFSPDGKVLAAGLGSYSSTHRGRLTLWEIPSGQNLADVAIEVPGGVNCLAFSPDGQTIATANSEVAEIWSRHPLKKLRELSGHKSWIYAVAFSPDGKKLATGGWDGTIRLWNPETGAQLPSLEGHPSFVNTLAFSPDSSRLASGGEDHAIRLWNVADGQKLLTLRGHSQGITSLDFSPDGQRIISASVDGALKLWDSTSDRQLVLRDHKAWVTSVVFSPDGKRMATSSGDKLVILWDVKSGNRLLTLEGSRGWVNSVAFSPDGKSLAAADEYSRVQIWNAISGAKIQSIDNLDNFVRGVTFSPDGSLLAACTGAHEGLTNRPGVVYVLNAKTRDQVQCFRDHSGRVRTIAFSPNGERIASGGGGGPYRPTADSACELLIWEPRTGRIIHRLRAHLASINSVVFSPNGRWLVSGSEDGDVRIWDAESGAEERHIQTTVQGALSLAFHPDGSRLAVGGYENIQILNPDTGEEILRLSGHKAGVVGLCFSPDGSRLASGSIDWTARIWDASGANDNPERDEGE